MGKLSPLAKDGTLLRADTDSTEFKRAAQQLDPKPSELSSAAFSTDGKWLLTVSSTKAQNKVPILQTRLWKWNDERPGRGAWLPQRRYGTAAAYPKRRPAFHCMESRWKVADYSCIQSR